MSAQREAAVDQPSARPTNKLVAGVSTGAVITVALAVLDSLAGASFDGAWWGSAVATACAGVAAYLRRNRAV